MIQLNGGFKYTYSLDILKRDSLKKNIIMSSACVVYSSLCSKEVNITIL